MGQSSGGTFWAKWGMWPTVASLVVLLAATLLDWYWVWGLVFLYWALATTLSGQAFIVQPVERDKHPALFWTVSAMWVVLSALVIVTDLFPEVLS